MVAAPLSLSEGRPRFTARDRVGIRGRRALLWAAWSLGAAALMTACGEPAAPKDASESTEDVASAEDLDRFDKVPEVRGQPPGSVILITLDTCRADRMSLYGYERPTTPELEKFATQATVYRKCKASAPWTLPAHGSIFTGLHPYEHGAHSVDVEGVAAADRFNNVIPLTQGRLTLTECFQANDWRTAAFVANKGFLAARYQLDQGFDHYDVERGKVQDVNARFLAWVRNRRDRPFFAFLNYMDCHRPYNTEPRAGFKDYAEGNDSAELIKALYHPVLMGEEVDAADLQRLSDLYDLAIANLDAGLGELFRRLDRLEILDRALVVIVGDHGEFLGEHDLLEHSKDVYEGAMDVPLLIKAPGQAEGREDATLISQVHLPGLILAHCDFEELPQGGGVFGRHWPRAALIGENYFSRMHDLRSPWGGRFQRIRSVVYEGDLKYVHSSDGQNELYDLGEDPDELENLLGPEEASRWAGRLAELMPEARRADPSDQPQEALSEEELDALEALGYIDRGRRKKRSADEGGGEVEDGGQDDAEE